MLLAGLVDTRRRRAGSPLRPMQGGKHFEITRPLPGLVISRFRLRRGDDHGSPLGRRGREGPPRRYRRQDGRVARHGASGLGHARSVALAASRVPLVAHGRGRATTRRRLRLALRPDGDKATHSRRGLAVVAAQSGPARAARHACARPAPFRRVATARRRRRHRDCPGPAPARERHDDARVLRPPGARTRARSGRDCGPYRR